MMNLLSKKKKKKRQNVFPRSLQIKAKRSFRIQHNKSRKKERRATLWSSKIQIINY